MKRECLVFVNSNKDQQISNFNYCTTTTQNCANVLGYLYVAEVFIRVYKCLYVAEVFEVLAYKQEAAVRYLSF